MSGAKGMAVMGFTTGSLIYNVENEEIYSHVENIYNFPLNLILKTNTDSITVEFGDKDLVKSGYVLSEINGRAIKLIYTNNQSVLDYLKDKAHYPVRLKFSSPRLKANDKIMLASMFHSLYAIISQLSPENNCKGIESIETDIYKLCCFQTLTSTKFLLIVDNKQNCTDLLLNKLYELYADYVLKNPFYSLEMPIRGVPIPLFGGRSDPIFQILN
ncbi:trafficking protein particle complex subunit 4-like isoform X2 [Gordionus sp. m RMFG-2023]|uniref:trafficking protein particle complex subunit 4-like isoform X2 n=1 Tax=Gordionus sp. m RMFG-2023 TaxID=3053472 RepID=UPI0031FD5566